MGNKNTPHRHQHNTIQCKFNWSKLDFLIAKWIPHTLGHLWIHDWAKLIAAITWSSSPQSATYMSDNNWTLVVASLASVLTKKYKKPLWECIKCGCKALPFPTPFAPYEGLCRGLAFPWQCDGVRPSIQNLCHMCLVSHRIQAVLRQLPCIWIWSKWHNQKWPSVSFSMFSLCQAAPAAPSMWDPHGRNHEPQGATRNRRYKIFVQSLNQTAGNCWRSHRLRFRILKALCCITCLKNVMATCSHAFFWVAMTIHGTSDPEGCRTMSAVHAKTRGLKPDVDNGSFCLKIGYIPSKLQSQ